ncbi:TIGR02594 family protein [uncultured Dokdonia sp.]|uniref:TIGR02594 family protein n=1 Tax=uncultured Dokdonia sp. TaxID=575653 RepID=UPI0026158B88|nr:TIGR02594 family protein [uncultured Dokdonia sp.]
MNTLITIALSQYGITEKVGRLHSPAIVNYFKEIGHQWVKDDETAWCSAFANWVALKANKQGSAKLNARSWLDVGKKVITPTVGDVVVFWRESKNSWKGHVGFFIGYSEDRTKIYCLGGNQNNQINIKAYPVYRLLGFRRL